MADFELLQEPLKKNSGLRADSPVISADPKLGF